MAKIERSNSTGRFTPEQLQAKTRESRAYWSSPAGKARQAQLDRENRSKATQPPKFSGLATTKPAIASTDLAARRLNLIK